jgi:hypothetical protein
VTVILDFRRPWGHENPYLDGIFRRTTSLLETASEDEAADRCVGVSRRFIDDDPRRFARGLAIALASGVSLWGVVALCVWFLW